MNDSQFRELLSYLGDFFSEMNTRLEEMASQDGIDRLLESAHEVSRRTDMALRDL